MRLKKPSFSTFYFTSVAILFLCSLSLNAQTDSLQGKSYEELGTLYDATIREDASEAKAYATKAYQLAKQENSLEKMALAKYNIARTNYAMGAYTTSIKNLDEVIPIAAEQQNNLLLFRSYNLKGNNLCELNKNNEAFDEYVEAREYAKLTKNPIHISTVAINIVLIKKIHKNHQECIDILLENLQLLKTLDDPSEEKTYNERVILMHLSDTYLRIKQHQKAQDYNKLALALTPKEEFPNTYYFILMNNAIIQYQIKNYQQSMDICKEIEEYYISNNEIPSLITPYSYIGKNSYQLQNFPQAIKYLEKTLAISDQFKLDFSERKEIYKFLQLSHIKIGNKEKASEYSIKYYELDEKNDSIDASLINRIHKEHDIVPLQEEIDSLGNDNQKKKRKSVTYILLLLF